MGRLHLDIKYTPKQLECRAALEDHSIVLYGGAKGGGKSFVARCLAVEYAFKYPGIYVAIFRRSFPELEANHIRPILQQFPVLKEFYKVGRKLIELDNGSVIEFCFCDHEDHLDKYQGREIQFLIIEEAGQFPQSWIARLSGSNRTSNPRIPARLLMTGNPGGISHAYLKRLFVDRNYLPHERPEDHYFIQATIASNPALEKADPNYRRRLEAEPNEALRRAFLYGEWDLFAGQFFPDFSPDVHIIPDFDEDNPMPSHWMRFGAYDHGYYHPAAFGWFAVDEDENVYMYREFLTRKQRPDEILEELFQYRDTYELGYTVAGHDCWSKQSDGGPTIEEHFSDGISGNRSLVMVKADINRKQGWAQLRSYLAHKNLPKGMTGPKFFVCKSCFHTIDAFPRMQHKKTDLEDMMKINCMEHDLLGMGDDQIEMIRFALMSRPYLILEETEKRGSVWDRAFESEGKQSWLTT